MEIISILPSFQRFAYAVQYVSMITQAKREQAFELFLTGQSLRAIASAIDVSRSTLERWSVSHDWVFQRAIIWNQRKQKALEDHIEKSKHHSLAVSEFFRNQILEEIGWYSAYAAGKIPQRAAPKPRRIREMTNAYWSAVYGEATYHLLATEKMRPEIRNELNSYLLNPRMKKRAEE